MTNPIPFHLQLSCASRETLAFLAPDGQQNIGHRLASLSKTWLTSTKAPNVTISAPSTSRPGSSKRPSSSHQKDKDDPHDRPPLKRTPSSLKPINRNNSIGHVDPGNDAHPHGLNLGKIVVSVQRHIAVQVHGQWMQIKKCISECTMKQCIINDEVPSRSPLPSLSWEGQLEIAETHRACGGFFSSGVRVRVSNLILIILLFPLDSSPSSE